MTWGSVTPRVGPASSVPVTQPVSSRHNAPQTSSRAHASRKTATQKERPRSHLPGGGPTTRRPYVKGVSVEAIKLVSPRRIDTAAPARPPVARKPVNTATSSSDSRPEVRPRSRQAAAAPNTTTTVAADQRSRVEIIQAGHTEVLAKSHKTAKALGKDKVSTQPVKKQQEVIDLTEDSDKENDVTEKGAAKEAPAKEVEAQITAPTRKRKLDEALNNDDNAVSASKKQKTGSVVVDEAVTLSVEEAEAIASEAALWLPEGVPAFEGAPFVLDTPVIQETPPVVADSVPRNRQANSVLEDSALGTKPTASTSAESGKAPGANKEDPTLSCTANGDEQYVSSLTPQASVHTAVGRKRKLSSVADVPQNSVQKKQRLSDEHEDGSDDDVPLAALGGRPALQTTEKNTSIVVDTQQKQTQSAEQASHDKTQTQSELIDSDSDAPLRHTDRSAPKSKTATLKKSHIIYDSDDESVVIGDDRCKQTEAVQKARSPSVDEVGTNGAQSVISAASDITAAKGGSNNDREDSELDELSSVPESPRLSTVTKTNKRKRQVDESDEDSDEDFAPQKGRNRKRARPQRKEKGQDATTNTTRPMRGQKTRKSKTTTATRSRRPGRKVPTKHATTEANPGLALHTKIWIDSDDLKDPQFRLFFQRAHRLLAKPSEHSLRIEFLEVLKDIFYDVAKQDLVRAIWALEHVQHVAVTGSDGLKIQTEDRWTHKYAWPAVLKLLRINGWNLKIIMEIWNADEITLHDIAEQYENLKVDVATGRTEPQMDQEYVLARKEAGVESSELEGDMRNLVAASVLDDKVLDFVGQSTKSLPHWLYPATVELVRDFAHGDVKLARAAFDEVWNFVLLQTTKNFLVRQEAEEALFNQLKTMSCPLNERECCAFQFALACLRWSKWDNISAEEIYNSHDINEICAR